LTTTTTEFMSAKEPVSSNRSTSSYSAPSYKFYGLAPTETRTQFESSVSFETSQKGNTRIGERQVAPQLPRLASIPQPREGTKSRSPMHRSHPADAPRATANYVLSPASLSRPHSKSSSIANDSTKDSSSSAGKGPVIATYCILTQWHVLNHRCIPV